MSRKNPILVSDRGTTYLYTKGGEYSLDGKDYIGEYNLANNEPTTGPIRTQNSQKLTKFYPNHQVYLYDSLKQFENLITDYAEPNPIVLRVKQEDYDTGYVTRFFVEKAFGSNRYPQEIDSIQAQRYNQPKSINGGLYNIAIVDWKLTGSLYSRYDSSGLLVEMGIYEHNALEVEKASQIIPNITLTIKNFIEFARPR